MKSKVFVLVLMLIVAVALIAQTATTPAADKKAACPCCEKMKAEGKAMDCCKDGKCCGEDGKMCARTADGKSCCKEGADCCKDGKCCGGDAKTAKADKKCCGGMCDREGHAKHGK